MKYLAHRVAKLMTEALALMVMIALVLAGVPAAAIAQTYPVNNPVYIPAGVLSAVNCAATPCNVVFNVNGLSSVTFRVSGSATGIVATIQGSNDRAASPTYTNLPAYQIGGPKLATIVGNGLYRVSTQGLTSVRLNLTAATGTVTVSAAGEPDGAAVIAEPPRKATYSAAFVAFAPVASPTDFFSLTGNANTIVEVKEIRCSGRATAAATQTLEAVVRSTANTGGTPTALTAVPHDSNSPAAQGAAVTYAANPTTGTLTGIVRSDNLTSVAASSTSGANPALVWSFGGLDDQPLILRGATQVFALNGAGASFGAGEALNCSITWEEQ